METTPHHIFMVNLLREIYENAPNRQSARLYLNAVAALKGKEENERVIVINRPIIDYTASSR